MKHLTSMFKQPKLFSTNYKVDLSKYCARFFVKSCLISRTYVVSLVVAEIIFVFSFFVALTRLNKQFEL